LPILPPCLLKLPPNCFIWNDFLRNVIFTGQKLQFSWSKAGLLPPATVQPALPWGQHREAWNGRVPLLIVGLSFDACGSKGWYPLSVKLLNPDSLQNAKI
jgi:hypothetical protein